MPIDMRNLRDGRGQPHGLINSLPNSVPYKDFSNFPEKDRETMKKQKKESEKLMDVVYVNSRGEGEALETTWAQWQGDNLDQYKFIHNQRYTIPKGLLDTVNGNPGLAKRSEILDTNGAPTLRDGSAEKIHCFYSSAL